MTRPLACLCIALCCAACVADPLPLGDGGADDRGPDGEPPPDGALDGLDVAFDRGRPPDAVPVVPDAAPDVLDAAPPVPDEGPIGPEVPPPGEGEVAVTARAGETFFVWIDDAGDVIGLRVDADGEPGEPTVLDAPARRPERVVAVTADGHPWVAYGSSDGPIVAFEVDLPRRTRRVLDALRGPPLLARAADGVLVIGTTADGALAWQRIDNDLRVEPPIVDPLGLPPPDDAAGIGSGVVLAWQGAEQCIQLDDADWRPTTNFLCRGGQMRLLSDGRRALVSRVAAVGNDEAIVVESLFDHEEDFQVAFFELSAGTRFPVDGDERAVIGSRIIDGSRRLAVSVIGAGRSWDTAETWADASALPFDRVGAFARHTLPALAREGVCPDGAACFGPLDCGRRACEGGVEADHLLALDFRVDGRPLVRRLPLVRRAIGQPPYAIPDPGGCLARAERCDLVDQDCDGRVDDGLCCLSTANVSYRWHSLRPVARSMVDGAPRYDFLFADVNTNNAYHLLYRFEGTDEWTGKSIPLRQDPSGVPGNLGINFFGARDGRFAVAAGGIAGLVARAVDEDGVAGGWALFMDHPGRRIEEGDADAPRPLVPLNCDRILAVDVLEHDSPASGNPDGEQVLVVCPDKMIRIYAVHPDRDGMWTFERFTLPPVSWATINRRGRGRLEVMVGFEVPGEGGWAVRAFEFDSDSEEAPAVAVLPDALSRLEGGEAAHPIYRHPIPGRPPIQVRSGSGARLAFAERDRLGNPVTAWRDALLGPAPERITFSPTAYRLFASGPVEPVAGFDEATGWWAVDVTGNDETFDLWSVAPIFKVQGPVAAWYATRGSYGLDDPLFSITRYDLGLIQPITEDDTQWRFVTRETRCIRP